MIMQVGSQETHPAFPDAEKIISSVEIEQAIAKMATQLQPIVDEGNCVLLGVMLGAMLPLTRLAQLLRGDFVLDTCHATRYQSGLSGKELSWLKQPSVDLTGRTVIVVDDIFDQGITLEAVAAATASNHAKRVYSAVLASKQHDRQLSDYRPDFCALSVPDRYVFGCGMDYRGHWRHLPDIYALRD